MLKFVQGLKNRIHEMNFSNWKNYNKKILMFDSNFGRNIVQRQTM